MQYFSPFTQMGISIDELKAEPLLLNFNVFKKRVLAEFELHKKVSINLPIGELSKNDVLLFFERIQKDFQYHTCIVKDAPLLKFLETNHVEEPFLNSYNNEDFLSFLEPHFVHSYCTFGIELLNNQDLSTEVFSAIPLLIPEEFNPDLFEPLKARINSLTHEIEEIASMITETDGIKPAGIYFQIYGNNTIKVLNALDNKLFCDEKNNYLHAAVQLVRACKKETEAGFRNEQLVEFILTGIEKLKSNILRDEIKRLSSMKKRIYDMPGVEEPVNPFASFLVLGGLCILLFFVIKGIIFVLQQIF